MMQQLTDELWFGDKGSIVECQPRTVICAAVNFGETYWDNVRGLPNEVNYIRMGLRDEDPVTTEHFLALKLTLLGVKNSGKLPLLCHCHLGLHRGPSTAIMAAFLWEGCHRLDYWIHRTIELIPSFANDPPDHIYRKTLFSHCRRLER